MTGERSLSHLSHTRTVLEHTSFPLERHRLLPPMLIHLPAIIEGLDAGREFFFFSLHIHIVIVIEERELTLGEQRARQFTWRLLEIRLLCARFENFLSLLLVIILTLSVGGPRVSPPSRPAPLSPLHNLA